MDRDGTLTFPYQHCFLQITLSTLHRYIPARPAYTCRVKYAPPIRCMHRGSRSYSLTKQKFMDSAEFSSLSVSSARGTRARRRRRCNSCNNLTLKPLAATELQLAAHRATACFYFRFFSLLFFFYRPADTDVQRKIRGRIALLNVRPAIKK